MKLLNYEIKLFPTTLSHYPLSTGPMISSPYDVKQLRVATSTALELYYIYTEQFIPQQLQQL